MSPYDALRMRLSNGSATEADAKFRDEGLVQNVLEARENGYELACTDCGVGLHDESDIHERWCPQFVEADS